MNGFPCEQEFAIVAYSEARHLSYKYFAVTPFFFALLYDIIPRLSHLFTI